MPSKASIKNSTINQLIYKFDAKSVDMMNKTDSYKAAQTEVHFIYNNRIKYKE